MGEYHYDVAVVTHVVRVCLGRLLLFIMFVVVRRARGHVMGTAVVIWNEIISEKKKGKNSPYLLLCFVIILCRWGRPMIVKKEQKNHRVETVF